MRVHFSCPKCGAVGYVEVNGPVRPTKKVRCPGCQSRFIPPPGSWPAIDIEDLLVAVPFNPNPSLPDSNPADPVPLAERETPWPPLRLDGMPPVADNAPIIDRPPSNPAPSTGWLESTPRPLLVAYCCLAGASALLAYGAIYLLKSLF